MDLSTKLFYLGEAIKESYAEEKSEIDVIVEALTTASLRIIKDERVNDRLCEHYLDRAQERLKKKIIPLIPKNEIDDLISFCREFEWDILDKIVLPYPFFSTMTVLVDFFPRLIVRSTQRNLTTEELE